MFELTGFQRDLLWIVASLDTPSGQEVLEALTRSAVGVGASVNIGQSRLYPNLNTLVDKGLVARRRRNRRTNAYVITDKGVEHLIQRRRWEESLVDIESLEASRDD